LVEAVIEQIAPQKAKPRVNCIGS